MRTCTMTNQPWDDGRACGSGTIKIAWGNDDARRWHGGPNEGGAKRVGEGGRKR